MYHQKHGDQCNQLKENRAHSDIRIFFQGFIEPLHPQSIECNGQADDQIKYPLFPESWHQTKDQKENNIGNHTHDHINIQKLMCGLCQLPSVIPHSGTGTDTISRNPQLRQHGKIRYQRSGKGYLPRPCRKQDSGNVGKGNQRKEKRRQR